MMGLLIISPFKEKYTLQLQSELWMASTSQTLFNIEFPFNYNARALFHLLHGVNGFLLFGFEDQPFNK